MKIDKQKLLVLALMLASSGHVVASDNIEIDDAWIAEAPPVSKVMAAYMEIENETQQDRRAISMQCEEFERAEFHRSVEKNGIASMEPQQSLLIKAGSELELEPGGYHIMLFNPARHLKAGEQTTCSMSFDDDTSISFQLKIRKFSAEDHSHHHNH